jgi:two-component system, OmpR family, sensor kinase
LSIRWRLTLFIALAIGMILLALGVGLFFLLRVALFTNIEKTAENRAENAVRILRSGEPVEEDDVEELSMDGVFVIVRDGEGRVLIQSVGLPPGAADKDPVWREALRSGKIRSGKAKISGDSPDYIYAVPVDPPRGRARVVETGKSYETALENVQDVVAILAAGIGVAFLLSIGGAYLLARTALRPVEAVTATAREMSEGELSRRLPVAHPKEEI